MWLGIINCLKNRGPENILITCVDSLRGFMPRLFSQNDNPTVCYTPEPYKVCFLRDIKALMGHQKKVYAAADGQTSLHHRYTFNAK
ncbi:MAG: hypothetical protein VB078_02675 [Clostridiaceae bacterium]|nr:hypothetical protein [Clostridiaceae bacterium]